MISLPQNSQTTLPRFLMFSDIAGRFWPVVFSIVALMASGLRFFPRFGATRLSTTSGGCGTPDFEAEIFAATSGLLEGFLSPFILSDLNCFVASEKT